MGNLLKIRQKVKPQARPPYMTSTKDGRPHAWDIDALQRFLRSVDDRAAFDVLRFLRDRMLGDNVLCWWTPKMIAVVLKLSERYVWILLDKLKELNLIDWTLEIEKDYLGREQEIRKYFIIYNGRTGWHKTIVDEVTQYDPDITKAAQQWNGKIRRKTARRTELQFRDVPNSSSETY